MTDTKTEAKPPKPEPKRDAQGEIVRDFTTAADAEAQAAIIDGTVVAIGVAYHVADAE